MKKMGFGSARKVPKGGDDDANKAALFGNAKSSGGSANPYAIQQNGGANDPYAPTSTPPPQYDGGMSDFRRDKTPVPQGGYGGGYGGAGGAGSRFGTSGVSDAGSRYGNTGGSYGDQGGYGSNRFGDSGASAPAPRRQGGYGGMGMSSQQTEEGRQALFGDAPNRYATQSAPPTNGVDNGSGGYGGRSGGYGATSGGYGGGSDSQGYGSYGDRELTAEEQEEEDIQATVSLRFDP